MDRSNRKKTALSALIGLAIVPAAANAADIYTPPAPAVSYKDTPAPVASDTWAGFYIGLNGGYAWSGNSGSIGYNDGGAGTFAGGDQSGRANAAGGFGGAQIGYNFQSGSFVYGLETDFQGGSLGDRVTGVTALGNAFTSRENVDWFGTVRGRVGYSFGRTLVYGTGGFAYGDVRQRAFVTDGGLNSVAVGNRDTQAGYVAGGGVEYKINPAWSLKAEYQYIDLGSQKLNGIDSVTAAPVSTNGLDTSFHTARIGLNYRIGGGYEPLK